jgi:hypothetical protein
VMRRAPQGQGDMHGAQHGLLCGKFNRPRCFLRIAARPATRIDRTAIPFRAEFRFTGQRVPARSWQRAANDEP